LSNNNSDTSAFIAAALIMLFVFLGVYFLPPLMKQMAEYNEWLAYGLGFAFVISFVLIFWLRSLFQKRQQKSDE
jgi:membrane protease YdiL (CAAX protease family)